MKFEIFKKDPVSMLHIRDFTFDCFLRALCSMKMKLVK